MAIPPIIVISKVPVDFLSVFFVFFLKLLTALILKNIWRKIELEACLACPDEAKANLAAQDGDLTQAMKEETL